MDLWLYSLAVLGSAVFGVGLVAVLSCKVRNIPMFAVVTVVPIALAIWAAASSPAEDIWIIIVSCLAAGLLGYFAMTYRLLHMDGPRQLPRLEVQRASNPGHLAVVYFTHGESQEYDQIAWVHQFKEFDHQELRSVPYLARPFFFAVLRSKYMGASISKHRSIHQKMMEKVRQEVNRTLPEEARFYLSFLDDEPRPDVGAAQAFNDGASTIVVCKVFLTTSNHTAEGDNQVKELKLEEKGVRMIFTEPLWDSVPLRRSFLAKADEVVRPEERATTGILLVGHGQPHEWDLEFATETEHEMKFREYVLKEFQDVGYKKENLHLAWMAFREPKVPDVVRQMAAQGVKKIVYFSAAISAEAIHSQSDIPELVEKARVSKQVEIVNMGAWNDHPLVIEAIREKIEKALREAG